jgi:hypothetical protein
MRRRFPAHMATITPRAVIAPVGEQGWLTPVRASAGSASDWLFDCRCGTRVVKRAKDVRKSVSQGRTPKCSRDCKGVRVAEAAQQ